MNEQEQEACVGTKEEARPDSEGPPGQRRGDTAIGSVPGEGPEVVSETAEGEEVADLAYGLLVGVRMSVRYHERRRAWFEGWHNLTLVIALIFVGGVSLRIAERYPEAEWWLSLIVALALAANVILQFAQRAAVHRGLAVRFIRLEKRIGDWDSMPYPTYRDLVAQRLDIESEEPTTKVLLSTLCQYETIGAMRDDRAESVSREMAKIRWYRRALAPVFSQVGFVTRELRSAA
ncbi:MAG: hypothetical protein F4060_06855 [Holophagales bacterium]|nr:hypothetical protein [Holophagales bacterium]MYG31800.1 hypothetical protein [Holophagales bacterium]MYI79642.1 hypothetical protein [Holophagales bacterium]